MTNPNWLYQTSKKKQRGNINIIWIVALLILCTAYAFNVMTYNEVGSKKVDLLQLAIGLAVFAFIVDKATTRRG